MLIRDLASGRPFAFLDGERLRDVNGKPVAARAGDDKQALKLADRAAAWMGGKPVLMDLGPGDVVVPATEADFGIPALECIADVVSPVKYVKHDRGYFFYESVGDAVQLVVTSGTADAQAMEVNLAIAKTQFTTTGYGIAAKLPRQILANADFDLKTRVTRRLVAALRLAREARMAALLTTTGNWPAGNQVAAAAKWDGGTSPNPLVDLFGALKASYLPATTLILPENAAPYFFVSQLQTYVQAGGELPRILFARAKQQAGGSPVYVWSPSLPTNVALVRVPADVETDIPTSMTLRWLGDGGVKDGERRDGVLVREFFAPQDDATWLVIAHNDVETQISNQVGALITGALA